LSHKDLPSLISPKGRIFCALDGEPRTGFASEKVGGCLARVDSVKQSLSKANKVWLQDRLDDSFPLCGTSEFPKTSLSFELPAAGLEARTWKMEYDLRVKERKGYGGTYASLTNPPILSFAEPGWWNFCYCDSKGTRPDKNCELQRNANEKLGEIIVPGVVQKDTDSQKCYRGSPCELKFEGFSLSTRDRLVVLSDPHLHGKSCSEFAKMRRSF
jgi:hypothetical protein